MNLQKKAALLIGAIIAVTLGVSAQAGAQSANTNTTATAQPSAQMTADAQKNTINTDAKKETAIDQKAEARQLAERETQAKQNAKASPAAKNGWENYGGSAWSYWKNGRRHTGWLHLGGKWYHFTGQGLTWTETYRTIDGKTYYFKEDASMATGWYKAVSSWGKPGKVWHYANSDGTITAHEWKKIGGKWYYFSPSDMRTGWIMWQGEWYYLGSDGVMRTGWIKQGTTWYYLRPSNGAMVTGTQYIDGRWHRFVTPGYTNSGGWLGYAD